MARNRRKKSETGLKHTIRSSLKANKEQLMKTKKQSGRAAHKNGLTAEKRLMRLTEIYQDLEPLEIELIRNHDNMAKARGKGGGLVAYTAGVSSIDFSFWTSENFSSIMGGGIEVKSRNSNRITKSCLSHHQKDQLIRFERLGHCGLVFISLEIDDDYKFWLVPIQHFYKGGKKSHNDEDLDVIGYPVPTFSDPEDEDFLLPDILGTLKLIDKDLANGSYKDLPVEYQRNNDNKKLKDRKSQYSTIDADLADIDPYYEEIDDEWDI